VDLQLCGATSVNPAAGASPFHPQPFFAALTSQDMGQLLLTTSSIESTQSFLRAHSQCLPAGTVLVADQQTQGKGGHLKQPLHTCCRGGLQQQLLQ
jgi:hypothetical protein